MNIGILGGGVGGLSAAIALKLKGFEVTVYERHKQVTEIGAGIVCWPNASFVLDTLGVLDSVRRVAGSLNYMNRFNEKGQEIGSLDVNELSKLMGYPSYSILRKDLMRILSQRAAELKISINYNHDVTELSESNNGTVVTFSNGKQIQPDIIIGADGRMQSLARSYVHGNNTPIYQGFINWIGVFESNQPVFKAISVSDYWGVGERFGIVPISASKAYWAGGIQSEKEKCRTPEQYQAELNSVFEDWPSLIGQVIDETPLSSMNKIYVHDHDPIDIWHKDNVVLLGDAAHSPLPTSGQGACQALEDAWHLANCLTDHSDNINSAFTDYTRLRSSKTTGIIIGGRQLASSIFNSDAEFCKHRNIASKNSNYDDIVKGMARGWASGLPISV